MLIIPLTGKVSLRNPPAISIALILINCFVFFVLQAGDGKRYERAGQFYCESGLAEIELSEYLNYARDTGSDRHIDPGVKLEDMDEEAIINFSIKIQNDHVFLNKLLNDEIITPEDDIYEKWKGLRLKFGDMMSKIVSVKYGLKPAERNLLTAFTYMFIHGSFMHLLGNMIFLWFVGCALELGCGRLLYTGIYILTGIFAAWLFAMVYSYSRVPLVGASGAISGLMGVFTVLYGKKKIKVFYSIGVYFNYIKAAGIILLPIWIGKEVFQLLFGACTQIAYMAHIGGLMSGALLGYLNLRFLGKVSEDVFGEDPKEKIAPLLEEALQRIGKVDMLGARPLLEQVLVIDSHNRSALTHLFNIDKLTPDVERFHQTASRLLSHLIGDKESFDRLYDTYNEYVRTAKHPRLDHDLMFQLGQIFLRQGYLKESERILAMVLKRDPGYQKLPNGILNLARVYLKKGMKEKGKKCLRIILQKYPASGESRIAEGLLKS